MAFLHFVTIALLIAGTALSLAIVLSNAPLVVTQTPRDVGALWLLQIIDTATNQRYRFGVLGWCKNTMDEPASLCMSKLLWKLPADDSGEPFLKNLPPNLSKRTSDIGICLVIVAMLTMALLGTILIWGTFKPPLYIWPGKPQFCSGLPQKVNQVGNNGKVAKPSFFTFSPHGQLALALESLIFIFTIPVWVVIPRAVRDVGEMNRAWQVSLPFGYTSSIVVYLLTSVGVTLYLLFGHQKAKKGDNTLSA